MARSLISCRGRCNAFDLRDDDRFALLSGLAYNHLHRDVFTPLAMGAMLYVPPAEIAREPQVLCEWLRDKFNYGSSSHSGAGATVANRGRENLAVLLRRIFFGGDVLTHGEVERIREWAPNATIGCFYGATETQRAVGYYEIPQDFTYQRRRCQSAIPLGQGIEDVQLLLLNKNGH